MLSQPAAQLGAGQSEPVRRPGFVPTSLGHHGLDRAPLDRVQIRSRVAVCRAAVSEKMLIQQLRQMERDGIVSRFVHHQVPPKVEYSLTDWGQALCPALDALLKWVDLREQLTEHVV